MTPIIIIIVILQQQQHHHHLVYQDSFLRFCFQYITHCIYFLHSSMLVMHLVEYHARRNNKKLVYNETEIAVFKKICIAILFTLRHFMLKQLADIVNYIVFLIFHALILFHYWFLIVLIFFFFLFFSLQVSVAHNT